MIYYIREPFSQTWPKANAKNGLENQPHII